MMDQIIQPITSAKFCPALFPVLLKKRSDTAARWEEQTTGKLILKMSQIKAMKMKKAAKKIYLSTWRLHRNLQFAQSARTRNNKSGRRHSSELRGIRLAICRMLFM